MKDELADSLMRTADPAAWTKRYPWASLGTAATAGMATGWTLGRAFRKSEAVAEGAYASEPTAKEKVEKQSATSRLVGGLGTLAGSIAGAAATAAAESLGSFVKDAIHNSLQPEPAPEPTTPQDPPDSAS